MTWHNTDVIQHVEYPKPPRVWFKRVTKGDAMELVRWWNAAMLHAAFEVRKADEFYEVWRTK
jgi:hypothetical protein